MRVCASARVCVCACVRVWRCVYGRMFCTAFIYIPICELFIVQEILVEETLLF